MMNKQNSEMLSRVATDTLEQLAFLFSFPENDKVKMDIDFALAARVLFTGPFSGALVITVSAQVLSELTANMLGVDCEEGTTSDQKDDALKETINVICGNLLPAIAGKRAVFDIDVPKIISGYEEIKEATEKYDGLPPTSMVILDIDGEQCGLYLFGDVQIP
jgi:chemotaxis protein CheY-P-specific phosphatase CheC